MNSRSIIIIIIVLALIVGVFAFINRSMIKDKKEVHENAEVLIVGHGNEAKLTLTDIKELGEEEFTADLKSSGKAAEEHTYTGVPVKNLLEKVDINLKDNGQVIVKAVDGYTVALDSNEVLEEDNVYIAYEIDGESFGSKEDGGSGPYQVIIRKDQFSQRWCKHVVEIEVNE